MKKIVSLMIAFSLMLGLFGCGGQTSEQTPEQAVAKAIDAVKTLNSEEATKYFDYGALVESAESGTNLDSESEELLKLFFQNLSYKIGKSTVNGDEATVTTDITNTDMSVVLKDMVAQAISLAFSGISEEELDVKYEQIFKDSLSKKDNKTITTTLDIKLNKVDGQWKIDADDAFGDALLGGIVSAAESFGNLSDDAEVDE